MIGQTVSHYRIVDELGAGGMGVVYRALDLKLNRHVALKFLSQELTKDAVANERFVHEAHAASALDHPNICTIYEIDEAPERGFFLVMACYAGVTLKQRIEQGPLPIDTALDIAQQVARGLARAHKSGIVHRDVKPANLFITQDGLVKILDFGLAKLTGPSEATRSGTTLGTIAYMAPELIRGGEGDASADVWALGVTLYEMLAGRRPFQGKDDLAVVSSILDGTAEPIGSLRAGLPVGLDRILSRALDRDLVVRYPSAESLLEDLATCRAATSGWRQQGIGILGVLRKPAAAAIAALALVGVGLSVALAYQRSAREQLARDVTVPEIRRLIGLNQRSEAYRLTKQIEQVLPSDAVLASLWPQVAAEGSMVTTPQGADVYMQDYSAPDGAAWTYVGKTPFENVRLPRGVFRFRVEKEGFEGRILSATNPGSLLRNINGPFGSSISVSLLPKGTSPEMVPVAAGKFPVSLSGFNTNERIDLDEFLIDRFEVTNDDFKKFIDTGGYEKPEYWLALHASSTVDSTGRPGPSTWELGTYPDGQSRFPVSGVSWFEAVAYCRSQNKTLPTVFHWARAGLSPTEISNPLAPTMIPLSHFGKGGTGAAGSARGVGPYGTYDMAGNVREWVWNESSGGRRWIAGGAWSDPQWMMVVPNSLPPDDRSAPNGFRCMRTEASIPDRLMAKLDHYAGARDVKPVSDEVYKVFARQMAYHHAPANARVDSTNDSNADWIRQVISFDAGYDGERTRAYLFLPRSASPPFQLTVFFGPLNDFLGKASSDNIAPGRHDFIVRSGRAFLYPIYKGSYERWDNFVTLQGDEYDRTFRLRLFQWRQELGRILDALSERPDIDLERLAYVGLSFGSSTAVPLLALEPRFKTAVLQAAGFPFRRLPPEVDAINHVGRITMPVLMLGGKLDFVLPVETAQKPMFLALGTPADKKRHVIFDSGHVNYPRSELIRETLSWLDRYLGPVNAAATKIQSIRN